LVKQKESLLYLIKQAKKQFPNAIVQGHKDFKGVVKACPSFDAKNEYKAI
jgi:N-acetylmuramoyl-L-alanine amidase